MFIIENFNAKEVSEIESKLKQCFKSLNINDMLNDRTFLLKAKTNAENVLNVLQSIISQRIRTNAKSLCWNTTLILGLDDEILKGSIGNRLIHTDFNSSDLADPRKYYQEMLREKINKGYLYSKVQCIPKVFLAGFPKCGSTSLDDIITVHPKIHHGISKEPRWWVPPLYHPNIHSFKATTNYFIKYLLQYQYNSMESIVSNDILLLDSSPNLLSIWYNIGYSETYEDICLLPTVISTIMSDAKFIVILRDPIEFLYSTFWFRCSSKVLKDYNLTHEQALQGPFVFHTFVQNRVTQFKKCSQLNSIEKCVLEQFLIEDKNPNHFQCGRVPLGMAIYYVHIVRWFSVFSRKQFYFLTALEFFQKPFSTVQKIWKFLDLSQPKLNHRLLKQRLKRSQNIQVHFNYHHNPKLQMLSQTHEILEQFFEPFNVMLSTLLNRNK